MKIFAVEPFKNSKSKRKEYVENELKDLAYIYCDPQTKVRKINPGIAATDWLIFCSLEHTIPLH